MTTTTHRTRSLLAPGLVAALLAGATLVPRPAEAAFAYSVITGRVSVTSAGTETSPSATGDHVALSSDGRFVAFTSTGALEPADTNGSDDVYLRDRMGGTTTRVSLTDADAQIGGSSALCGMSRDARYVAFVGTGSGLPIPLRFHVYLRDRKERTTELISVSTGGDPSYDGSSESGIWADDRCAISDDGRYVAFLSEAPNLAGGDENGNGYDVFRRDRQTDSTQRVTVSTASLGGNGDSEAFDMSANGDLIAFSSSSTNLVPNDTNAKIDVFLRAMGTAQTTRVSVTGPGAQLTAPSETPAISADGTRVGFVSAATNLVAGDTNAESDAFVRNLANGTVTRVSLGSGGAQLTASPSTLDLSQDGRYVSFSLYYGTDVAGDTNKEDDVYRRDTVADVTQLVSVTANGVAGNSQSYRNAISSDGLSVAFLSDASDLVRNDGNAAEDAFVRDYFVELTPFTGPISFVKQQYVDFEGRQPTDAERSEWVKRITNGERTPDELIDELAHGATWSAKRAPLTRLYWAFFLRAPDSGGMTYWTNQLTGGKKLATVAKQFSQSSEFQAKYGSKTNSQFVTLIYQNIFDRDPDAGGLAYWTNKLNTKQKTRGDVMVNFSESSEGKRVLAPQTDTVLIYLGMLRKMPSAAILLEGIAALRDQGYPPEIVAESVRELGEYASRITP